MFSSTFTNGKNPLYIAYCILRYQEILLYRYMNRSRMISKSKLYTVSSVFNSFSGAFHYRLRSYHATCFLIPFCNITAFTVHIVTFSRDGGYFWLVWRVAVVIAVNRIIYWRILLLFFYSPKYVLTNSNSSVKR
jgi:hypothetical protein